MKRLLCTFGIIAILSLALPALLSARGTRYFINWPKDYIGPVYVVVYDIKCHPPYERQDKFTIWVTWGDKTKAYKIGNRGNYTLKFYKYERCDGPMIVSGNAAWFRIRYSMTPPWI
jgi:hypothetical protein